MTNICEQSVLWTRGTCGYNTYRIPALVVTTSGIVLAFSEGRKSGSGDSGDIDTLLKRSEDGGRTWSAQHVIWDQPGNVCGNPCAVVDHQTGHVLLLMTHNLGVDRESQIIDHTSKGGRTVWISISEDDGLSWSAPEEITATTKRPNWTWYATGPGNGIQLTGGRLLIPCTHSISGTRTFYSHVIYSDDHGQSWQIGGTSREGSVNECCVAELENGSVILNMRNYDPDERTRQIALSKDGGVTWSKQWHDDALLDPICHASLIKYPSGDDLVFCNPASRDARRNMTIRLSRDGGNTWPYAKTLHPGFSEYSSLAVLPDRTVACLYEYGENDRNEHLMMARFQVDWIQEGCSI